MRLILALAVALTVSEKAASAECGGAGVTSDRALATIVFAKIAEAARASAVPIFVPATLPLKTMSHIHAIVNEADRRGYSIELSFRSTCVGGAGCHVGRIEGRPSSGTRIPGRPLKIDVLGGAKVTGYFSPGACNAYCSDSTVTFDYRGNRYVIGDRSGAADRLAAHLRPM